MDQQSTALLYGFCASTSGAERGERKVRTKGGEERSEGERAEERGRGQKREREKRTERMREK